MSENTDPDDDNEKVFDQLSNREKDMLREVWSDPKKRNQESINVMEKLTSIIEKRALKKIRDQDGAGDQN